MTAIGTMLDRISGRRAYPAQISDTGQNAGIDLLSLFSEALGANTAAGVRVNHDVALKLSAVWRAVWVITMSIATQKVRLVRQVDDEKVDVIGRRRYKVFRRPNPEVSSMVFWATTVGHEVLTGNAFLYVVTDDNRIPVEFWPIEPERVQVGRDKRTRRKVYLIDHEVPQADYYGGNGNVVHFMGLSRDGLRGMSPVEMGAQNIGLSLAAEQYSSALLGKSSTPGGILSTEQVLSPEEAEAASDRWKKYHQGSLNAGEVAVFGKGTKWMSTKLSPGDAQLIATREFQVADVERWFGVPPHLMMDVTKTTSWGQGISEQGDAFVRYTLNPHTKVFEETISDELLPAGVTFDFDASALLRGNFTQQINAVGALIRSGFEPQAALAAVGLDPIEHTGNPPVGAASPTDGATPNDGAQAEG